MTRHDFRGAVEKRRSDSLILRESDVMRQGVPATLLEIQADRVFVLTEEEFEVGESVKLELSNFLQRYTTTVRGVVKTADAKRNAYRLEFSLMTRLNPHEVLTLRMQIRTGQEPVWF
jgi:hypothetical protein